MRDRFERKLNTRKVAQEAGIQVVSDEVPRAKLAVRMDEHIADALNRQAMEAAENQPARRQRIPGDVA